MPALVAVVSCALLFVVLWDAFEAIVLPRRVTRRLRLTRLFYRYTWLAWSVAGRRMRPGKRRERYLSYYGPLSMLLLLSVWAASLIVGFAMLQWALGSAMNAPEGTADPPFRRPAAMSTSDRPHPHAATSAKNSRTTRLNSSAFSK